MFPFSFSLPSDDTGGSGVLYSPFLSGESCISLVLSSDDPGGSGLAGGMQRNPELMQVDLKRI